MAASLPLSVVLPPALRARLALEARRRGLPLSTAVRALVAERVRELDESEELSAADRWQRSQAWQAWEEVREGDVREATPEDLDRDFSAALARARRVSR